MQVQVLSCALDRKVLKTAHLSGFFTRSPLHEKKHIPPCSQLSSALLRFPSRLRGFA